MSLSVIFDVSMIFTFHHVSIKTEFPSFFLLERVKFTFHHVSIKTYLPIHLPARRQTHSHSTMYLLKLNPSCRWLPRIQVFTFHHVSIKTITVTLSYNSHSTMYLLKLNSFISYNLAFLNSHSTMYLLKRSI